MFTNTYDCIQPHGPSAISEDTDDAIHKILCKKCLFISILCALCLHTSAVFAAAQTPEKFVHEFYTWYFKADRGDTVAERQERIYTYVDKEIIEYIRGPAVMRLAYFTKVQTSSLGSEKVKVITQKAIPMADNIYVVPVTFRDGELTHHVIVYVQKTADSFSVIKVSDIYPYS